MNLPAYHFHPKPLYPQRFSSGRFVGGGVALCRLAADAATRCIPVLATAAALVLSAQGQVQAGNYTWNTTSGNWSDGSDWSWFGTGVVPSDGSYATVSQAGAVVNFDYTYNDNTGLGGLNLVAGTGSVRINQVTSTSAMWVYYSSGNSVDRNSEIVQGNVASSSLAMYNETAGTNFTDGLDLGANGVYYLDLNSGQTGSLQAGLESVGSGAYFAQGGGINTASNLVVSGKYVLGDESANSYATGVLEGNSLSTYQSGVNETINQGGSFLQQAQPYFPSTNDANFVNISGTSTIYQLGGGDLNVGDVQISGAQRTLVPGMITVSDNASFSQTGGLVQDAVGGSDTVFALDATGTFTYSGGTFNARLINQGTFKLSGTNYFDAGNGMENDVPFTITSGQTISLDGLGLNNQASMTIQGGTLTGAGTLTNNSEMFVLGTIGGIDGFVNNGTVGITYGSNDTQIVLTNTGHNINNGTFGLTSGYSLSLGGSAISLANAGTINLNGGSVNGTGTLNNNSGGSVNGPGVISALINNSGGEIDANGGTITLTNLLGNNSGGEILVNDNSAVNSLLAFSSSGEIVLGGNNAVLAGGAVNNTGTISGFGRVGNTVANSGTIRADGGTLSLTGGGITNGASGNIEAGTGDTVFVGQGLAVNDGTIALAGGTFDNNNNSLQISATGYLVGSGTVRTGSLTNLNSISMADAPSSFYGPVINGYAGTPPTGAPTPTIQITGATATFYGPVTNESGAIIISTSATIRYLGAFVNNGTAISDPSTTTFTTITDGTTGVTDLSAGDTYKVLLSFYNNSTQNTAWNTSKGVLEFTGNAHTMTVAGTDYGPSYSGFTNNFAWGQLILDSGGSLTLGKGSGLGENVKGAFYTYALTLGGGISQISNITGDGVNIYYDPANSSNAYLGDKTYALTGGGEIAPVPEPAPLALLICAGAGMLLCRRESKRMAERQ